MNYYEHHLGDYMRDAAHLSMIEDGAYRRLIDIYYTREAPLPLDVKECQKLSRCTSAKDRAAVVYVLSSFFKRTNDGYRNKRCDEEIAKAKARISAARSNGQKGGRPKADHNPDETEGKPTGLSAGSDPLTQTKALHLPPPTSQSPPPRKRGEREARASRLPTGWPLTPERRGIAESEHLDAERTFARFTDHWTAADGRNAVKRDWDAAWRNWCRKDADDGKGKHNGNGTHAKSIMRKTADELEAEEIAHGIAAGRSDEEISSDYHGNVTLERIRQIRAEVSRAQH